MSSAIFLFQSDRLQFREFSLDDLDFVQVYASDLDVVKYQQWGPNTLDQTREFLLSVLEEQKANPRMTYNLAIVCKHNHHLIGGIFATRNPDARSIEIGFSLCRTSWGQGFAKESATALLHFIKQKYPHDKFIATCDTRNVASMNVLEKCGFKRIQTILNHMILRDGSRDTFVYEL